MTFDDKIQKFNSIYALPHPEKPTLKGVGDWKKRISDFQSILSEEVEEGKDILEGTALPLNILTEMADWYGDIIVYAWSEAARYGIPIEKVLDIIMASNFSKLDEDGNPIKDKRNKVLKGPLYWAPEDKIRKLLQELGVE